MAGSVKEALEQSGLAPREEPKAPVDDRKWLHELPEEDGAPHIPFEKPALLKARERPKNQTR